MKKQLLIIMATLMAMSPVSTLCRYGGAIAGGLLGAAALTGIAASAHHRHHYDPYYYDRYYDDGYYYDDGDYNDDDVVYVRRGTQYRNLEAENRQLRRPLAKQRKVIRQVKEVEPSEQEIEIEAEETGKTEK